MLPLIVAAAGTAAGTGLSMAGASEAASAEEKATQNALAMQKPFQKKGSQVFQGNLDQNAGLSNVQGQMAQGQNQALNMYKTLQSAPTGQGQGLVPTDALTQANVQAKVGQGNQAGSALQGYGAQRTQQQIGDLQAGTQLGVNSQESAGIGQTLPYLLQDASHAGDKLAGIGSLMSTLGMLGGLYGASQPGGLTGAAPMGNTGYFSSAGGLPSGGYLQSTPAFGSAPSFMQNTNMFGVGGVY